MTAQKPIFAPNSKPEILERWRRDGRLRAIGAITLRGGQISGEELGAILGMSPRALRHVLVRDGHFTVEYRGPAATRGVAWYRVRPDSIEPVAELPPIRDRPRLLTSNKEHTYRGGPTSAIDRFMALPEPKAKHG